LAIRNAYLATATRAEAADAKEEAAVRSKEITELTRIGVALTTERDLNTLLELILSQARQITASDAGSLYLIEKPEDEPKRLRFKLAQNHSRPDIPLVEFTMPIDHRSIAGYAASTGEPLVLDDAYFLPRDVEYTFNRSVDEKYEYRTKSMMTIPMKDHKDEVIGVLQLINRKYEFATVLDKPKDFEANITPYSPRTVELVSALAGQAAVSIENSQLYESIERLFEGFVRAAVTAIEQRDPTTFGHSGRVATMTVGLAESVDRISSGNYRDVNFSREQIKEIRYAALLHDFGKVGVREQVLVKAKKLYPPDLTLIRQRYAFIHRTAEKEFLRQRLEHLEKHGKEGYDEFLAQAKDEFAKQLESLNKFMQLVSQSNEPTLLAEGSFEELLRFAEVCYQDLSGDAQPYLTDDEVRYLTIRKGSLDAAERLEIESHVQHTYEFLLQIPWTKELKEIPLIAYGHHEKLNGRGYPRKVAAPDIPIQTRMMTISDIYDALTASDRPYKRAVPVERALAILEEEVEGEMLDPDLFQVFTQARVFERQEPDS
jgi:HD-GYP domain-containing protein (c-di-GMP phosphodiesterase class II)